MRNALIPSRPRAATTVVETNTLPATASPADKLVLQGVADLFLFASPQKASEDKVRQSQLYLEALAPFAPEVRAAAVASLRFDNPRNPYQPTHQDVRERCEKLAGEWKSAIQHYFSSFSDDPHWPSVLHGAPLKPGCAIPAEWVKSCLSDWLVFSGQYRPQVLENWERPQIVRIPEECFPEGLRERLLARVAERETDLAERQRKQAYLESLDPELREHRSDALRWNSHLGEEQIIELAKESIERERQKLAALT